jgi:[ribosomal protein S18]-alanine N-acetyltransferase
MIRPYTDSDKDALLALLRLNTPRYFDPSEENDFVQYLDHEKEDYYVLVSNDQLVGAGGINYFPETQTARLSWDLIHPAHQGKGLGRKLVCHRIDAIQQNSTIRHIMVRTSQHTYRFYEKVGFTLIQTQKDYWAPGFDLYQMQWVPSEKSV